MNRRLKYLIPIVLFGAAISLGAITQIDLAHQSKGILPVANGGLNTSSAPSSDGQIPIWNAGTSAYVPGDPLIGGLGTSGTTSYLNCDNSAVYDASTNGATQLVALSSLKVVYVCGFQISQSTSTTVSVKLVYGTGTACATGETAITPNYPLQAPASTGPVGMVVMTNGFQGLKTAASNELCIKTSAGVSVQALVWYTQR